MRSLLSRLLVIVATSLLSLSAAHAQWAVVDVGAIAQLVEQLQTLQQQLSTARAQLAEQRAQYTAITGSRGMQRLLRGANRNYLPQDWATLVAAARGTEGAYSALAAEIEAATRTNAVLSATQLAALSPSARADIEASRRIAALMQGLARQALQETSHRFASIEQLIDFIGTAGDQKAVLDLQARIGAEAAMLANEQSKLEVLRATAHAESEAQRQRLLERAITDIGSLRQLPPLRF
ncbi:type IV secretion system protein [Peristeroidobacter soli]|uniref:type IV secretion system protein n=1 Tax=Peristeroidobacter soli TaxID=2497877 RepID=UPI00101C90C3|nr:type IV secretion system protein [Peristeroidobacter soli]